MLRRAAFVGSVALLAMVGFAYSAGLSVGKDEQVAERIYELRTYTAHPGRLEALNRRFRDHTMQLFEKHGMRNEMYWVPTDPELAENTLIYIVSHESEEAAKRSWAAFRSDPEWIKARDASEADGKIVAKVESVYMKPTVYSPRAK